MTNFMDFMIRSATCCNDYVLRAGYTVEICMIWMRNAQSQGLFCGIRLLESIDGEDFLKF